MRTLHHHPSCPLSRQARFILSDLKLDCEYVTEDYWLRNENLLKLNPSGEVPILVEENGQVICGIYPLIEYFAEKYSAVDLMPETIEAKSEMRRMLAWFNNKFYKEVSNYVLEEKLIRPITTNESPRTAILRAAKINLKYQLRYLSYLIEQRGFFAIDRFTFADIAAAAHISVLDYFNEIFWDQYPALKEWYLIVKSKPSFRPILNDNIKGIKASHQYSLLDF